MSIELKREIDQLRRDLDALRRDMPIVPLRTPPPAAPSEAGLPARFKVTNGSDFPDHILGRKIVDGEEEDDDTVIAKSDWLQRTRYDGKVRHNLRYTYTSNTSRTVNDLDAEQKEVISRTFLPLAVVTNVDEIVLATKIEGGTGLTVDGTAVEWMLFQDRDWRALSNVEGA